MYMEISYSNIYTIHKRSQPTLVEASHGNKLQVNKNSFTSFSIESELLFLAISQGKYKTLY